MHMHNHAIANMFTTLLKETEEIHKYKADGRHP
jgi:hypothetical protein